MINIAENIKVRDCYCCGSNNDVREVTWSNDFHGGFTQLHLCKDCRDATIKTLQGTNK